MNLNDKEGGKAVHIDIIGACKVIGIVNSTQVFLHICA